MRICDFKIFKYHLTLARPLLVHGHPVSKREGFIIKLTDENGLAGYGETAPLPGVSAEMVDIVLNQLKDLATKLRDQNIPSGIEKLNGKFSTWLHKLPLAPSVHFGIESAVLSLRANQVKQPLAELLDKNYQTTLTVNGLLQGNREEVLKDAKWMLDAGYSALKLKVGDPDVKKDIATTNALTKLIAGRALLRLDANRAWNFEQTLEYSKSVDYAAIEYFEEPMKDFEKIPDFYNETTIPLAVDESLKQHSLKEIKSLDGIEVVILKPTLIGGFEKIEQLVSEAHSYGIRTVISSSFESGIGMRALANLSACFSRHVAVGLDTIRWFERDVVNPPIHIEHGKLAIEHCQLNDVTLSSDLLQEV